MIKAIFIDVDNTLLDFGAGVAQAIAAGFCKYRLPHRDHILDTFHRINNDLWRRIECGTLTREELYRIRWNAIFDALDIQADGAAFERYFRAFIRESAEPICGAAELLQYLSGKYSVFVTSNAAFSQQRRRLEKAGFAQYLQAIITSEQAGAAKPEKDFFDYCMTYVGGIAPQEILLIGDSPDADINGGSRYGLKTCWFNYHRAEAPPNLQADYTVSDLREIMRIV